jgi:capsular polysaccharide export protein
MPCDTVATFSLGIARLPHLLEFLGARRLLLYPAARDARGVDGVLAWGLKPNTERAAQYATVHKLPLLRLEDGFVRSVGLGVEGARPLSLVLDAKGMYYDASAPSELEDMIRDAPQTDDLALTRAQSAMRAIVQGKVSKYNGSPVGLPLELLQGAGRPRVLVVDQTRGDMSVVKGLVPQGGFQDMIQAAIDENPEAEILLKIHPDVAAGKKRGCFDRIPVHPRVRVLGAAVSPIDLLAAVDRVYCATSQLGFEALMVGKPVTCFGAPFYAGWGLTDDRIAVPRRGVPRSLPQVFEAAYLRYARYVAPDSGAPCAAEEVISHLALQRQMFEANAGRIFCFGFSIWKRGYARAYLQAPGNRVSFCRTSEAAKRKGFARDCKVVCWGVQNEGEAKELRREFGVDIWRMEDGFLRSVGLGSDLTAPASLVLDKSGLHYDPSAPCDLERILLATSFSPRQLERARELRKTIVEARISKYNLGIDAALELPGASGRKVVLVPGQVEDDAAVALGCRDIHTNAGLLEAVRQARPDAFIAFKPHPDVVSGNRRGAVPPQVLQRLCDVVLEDTSINRCLEVGSEVHTMTSLVGFEALLRGLPVLTYGQPFYGSWGLTTDRHPIARRTRVLCLDELVAGVLLLYPRYMDVRSWEFTSAERVIATLESGRQAFVGSRAYRTSRSLRQLYRLGNLLTGIRHAR